MFAERPINLRSTKVAVQGSRVEPDRFGEVSDGLLEVGLRPDGGLPEERLPPQEAQGRQHPGEGQQLQDSVEAASLQEAVAPGVVAEVQAWGQANRFGGVGDG